MSSSDVKEACLLRGTATTSKADLSCPVANLETFPCTNLAIPYSYLIDDADHARTKRYQNCSSDIWIWCAQHSSSVLLWTDVWRICNLSALSIL